MRPGIQPGAWALSLVPRWDLVPSCPGEPRRAPEGGRPGQGLWGDRSWELRRLRPYPGADRAGLDGTIGGTPSLSCRRAARPSDPATAATPPASPDRLVRRLGSLVWLPRAGPCLLGPWIKLSIQGTHRPALCNPHALPPQRGRQGPSLSPMHSSPQPGSGWWVPLCPLPLLSPRTCPHQPGQGRCAAGCLCPNPRPRPFPWRDS